MPLDPHVSRLHVVAFLQPTMADGARATGTWARLHARALTSSRNNERAIVRMVESLRDLASFHAFRYDSAIADDYVLGAHWLAIAHGVVGMLNGDCGDLDSGTVDRTIRDLAEAAGFTRDLTVKP